MSQTPPEDEKPGERQSEDFSQVEFRPREERGGQGPVEKAIGMFAKALMFLFIGVLLLFGTCLIIVVSN